MSGKYNGPYRQVDSTDEREAVDERVGSALNAYLSSTYRPNPQNQYGDARTRADTFGNQQDLGRPSTTVSKLPRLPQSRSSSANSPMNPHYLNPLNPFNPPSYSYNGSEPPSSYPAINSEPVPSQTPRSYQSYAVNHSIPTSPGPPQAPTHPRNALLVQTSNGYVANSPFRTSSGRRDNSGVAESTTFDDIHVEPAPSSGSYRAPSIINQPINPLPSGYHSGHYVGQYSNVVQQGPQSQTSSMQTPQQQTSVEPPYSTPARVPASSGLETISENSEPTTPPFPPTTYPPVPPTRMSYDDPWAPRPPHSWPPDDYNAIGSDTEVQRPPPTARFSRLMGTATIAVAWFLFWPVIVPWRYFRRRQVTINNTTEMITPFDLDNPNAGEDDPQPPTIASKPESTLDLVIRYSTHEIPKEVYINILLRLPSLYFSRVARIFEEADMSLGEIKKMALKSASMSKQLQTNHMVTMHLHFERGVKEDMPPAYLSLKMTWEGFIDSVLREWKTFNIISVLLLSAILTILQIDAAANDYLTRYTALASLICALMSLLYGCMYIIRFGTMRTPYKAAEWALEAKKQTLVLWNVWVLLAMPAVWLSWSLILYICCIMSFLWRTNAHPILDSLDSLESEHHLPAISKNHLLIVRILISVLLGFGILYGILIVKTFSRYGEVMENAWKRRIKGWIEKEAQVELERATIAPPQTQGYPVDEGSGYDLNKYPDYSNQQRDPTSFPTPYFQEPKSQKPRPSTSQQTYRTLPQYSSRGAEPYDNGINIQNLGKQRAVEEGETLDRPSHEPTTVPAYDASDTNMDQYYHRDQKEQEALYNDAVQRVRMARGLNPDEPESDYDVSRTTRSNSNISSPKPVLTRPAGGASSHHFREEGSSASSSREASKPVLILPPFVPPSSSGSSNIGFSEIPPTPVELKITNPSTRSSPTSPGMSPRGLPFVTRPPPPVLPPKPAALLQPPFPVYRYDGGKTSPVNSIHSTGYGEFDRSRTVSADSDSGIPLIAKGKTREEEPSSSKVRFDTRQPPSTSRGRTDWERIIGEPSSDTATLSWDWVQVIDRVNEEGFSGVLPVVLAQMKDPNPVIQLHTLDLVRFLADEFADRPPNGWDEFVRNVDLARGLKYLSSYSNKNTIERVRSKANDVMERLWGPGGIFPGPEDLTVSQDEYVASDTSARQEQGGTRVSRRVSVDSINLKLDELFKNRKM